VELVGSYSFFGGALVFLCGGMEWHGEMPLGFWPFFLTCALSLLLLRLYMVFVLLVLFFSPFTYNDITIHFFPSASPHHGLKICDDLLPFAYSPTVRIYMRALFQFLGEFIFSGKATNKRDTKLK
jgi:hypothetical protein